MKQRSIISGSVAQFQCLLEEALSGDFHPTLAIVFASIKVGLPGLVPLFEKKSISVFGCSSCGEILFNGNNQGIFDESIVTILVELDPDCFRQRIFQNHRISSAELGAVVGAWGNAQFENPSFLILVSGLSADGDSIVEGITQVTGEGTVIFGGLAGDDLAFRETFIFSDKEIYNEGANVIVFDKSKVDLKGLAASGWVGIGADKIVTRSEGNVVYTIDDEPALDVYKSYLNVKDEDLPEIGVEFPLLIKKTPEQHVLRAVMAVDREQKSLSFAGTVPRGSAVSFSSSPGFEIVELIKRNIDDLFSLDPSGNLMILFSCVARHQALGPIISDEIRYVSEKWKIPLIGFFTYGEIGTDYRHRCEFYNQTFTLAKITIRR